MNPKRTLPITASDLQELEAAEGKLFEVMDGILRENDLSGRGHGRLETYLITLLYAYVQPRKLGNIYPGDMTYVVEGTRQPIIKALKPDGSFMTAERDSDDNQDDFHYIAPDLAIEIISSSERPHEIEDKIKAYFKYGTRLVATIYREEQRIVLHRPDGTNTIYEAHDTLILEDILSGFTVQVGEFFTNA